MRSSRKKNSPTLAELHKIFPPYETVKKYSYRELLTLYNNINNRELVVPDSSELIDDYKTYLENSSMTGGHDPQEVKIKDFVVGKSYRSEIEGSQYFFFLKKFITSKKSDDDDETIYTCDFEEIYTIYKDGLIQKSDSASIGLVEENYEKYYEADESILAKDPDLQGESYINRAPNFIKNCHVALVDEIEAEENYPKRDNFQILKHLESHRYIYGMQNVSDDCEDLYKMMKYLRVNKNIKRFVCLQCGSYERDMWLYVAERVNELENSFFYDRHVQDYISYSFENAMSILQLIHESKDSIVFHCTAGWGRTGSVMFLILLYFRAIRNRNVLRKPLNIKTHYTDGDIEDTSLCKEYSFEAAKEFYEFKNLSTKLWSDRINIAYQAVAHTVTLHDSTNTQTAYRQYTDYDDLEKQTTLFTEYVLKDKKDIIILVENENMSNSITAEPLEKPLSHKSNRSSRPSNKSARSNRSSRPSNKSARSNKTTKKSAGWLSNFMGID